MKKILYLAAATLLFASCEDFLDSQSYTKATTDNYPQTIAHGNQMIAGAYSTLNSAVATPVSTFLMVSELASDDRLGGGGENDKAVQAIDLLMNYNQDLFKDFYVARYKGINRANNAIIAMDNIVGNEVEKNQLKGEAYFLRAFFNYELTSLFGEIILNTDNLAVTKPKATADQIYAQIASDLKMAVSLMSSEPYTTIEAGHATKWAAEALMARVFLFYTGFYGKTEMPLLTEGESVTKDDVIAMLEDCIEHSGHTLVDDYRELWAYTNNCTVEDYSKTADKELVYAENDGASSPETIWAIKFSNFAGWNMTPQNGTLYSNQYILYWGLRGGQPYDKTFPFGQGWGMGPVNPTLWENWAEAEPTDMRREASIIDIPSELPNYTKGGWADFVQETDYWIKKYAPITCHNEDKDGNPIISSSFSVKMYGTAEDMQLDHTQDIIVFRLADVYLMHSELTGTATYMTKVRERAGLDPVGYSLTALQNERRWELAFEGVRWNDIRRWGLAADLLDAQTGVKVYYKGTEETNKKIADGYKARYLATKGFFPLPESEVSLTNGVLTQTPGWESQSSKYTGWK